MKYGIWDSAFPLCYHWIILFASKMIPAGGFVLCSDKEREVYPQNPDIPHHQLSLIPGNDYKIVFLPGEQFGELHNPGPLEAPVIRATFLFLMVLTPPQAAQAVLIRLMPANRTFRPIIVPMAKAVMEGFIMLRMPRTISRMPLSMTTHQRLAMTFVSKVLWN